MATAAAAPARRWAREYETIYILRPDVDADVQQKVVDRAKDVIERLGGTLTKLDNWGRRRLAYPIRKNTRGIFVYFKYVGFSDLVAELERNLRLLDEVVRFQTVLLADEIDPASVTVDPEEVQYLQVEEPEEDEEDAELERARSLGMAPRPPRESRPPDTTPEGAESAKSEQPPAEAQQQDAATEPEEPEEPAEAAEEPATAAEEPAEAAKKPEPEPEPEKES